MKKIFRKPLGLFFIFIFLIALVPTIFFVHASAAHATGAITYTTPNNPSIGTSESVVRLGQTINVFGQGFAANENLNLEYDTPTIFQLGSVPCDYAGNCYGQITFNLAPPVPQGIYILLGTGSSSGLTAQIPLGLAPSIVLSVPRRGMSTNLSQALSNAPVKVGPGTQIIVTGNDFAANETVQVYLGTSNGMFEGTATSDMTGTLSTYFSTPTTILPGTHTVTVVRTNQKPSQVGSSFEILPPQMTNTPGIRVGQPIRISLKGFQAQEQVTISWDANGGQQLGSIFTDPTGAIVSCPHLNYVDCIHPPSAPPGSYTLRATGLSSGLQATSTLNVGPGILTTPLSAGPGSTITVTGGGFSANETVNVYFQNPQNGIVSTTTDATGAFTTPLTLPTRYTPHVKYYISATNLAGTEYTRKYFAFGNPSIPPDEVATFGTPFYFIGSGFQANEQINLYWNYHQKGQMHVATATADQYGSFALDITTPSSPVTNVTLAGIGVSSHLVGTGSAYENGGLVVNPSIAIAGTKIQIRGGGFNSNETITVNFGQMTIATITSNAAGGFAISYVVPSGMPQGSVNVQARGAISGIIFNATFYVSPTLKINPKVGPSGTPIVVTGQQFPSNTSVEIYWYYPETQSGVYLTTVSTDSNGNLSGAITAPTNLVPGKRYYVQVYLYNSPIAEAAFTAQ